MASPRVGHRRARACPRPRAPSAPAPLPDGQRAQDYAASLRLAVGSVAELSRSTQSVLDTVHSLGGAVVTVDYGTPSAGSGSALIDLRVPVGRAQEALRALLGARHDHGAAGADPRPPGRARPRDATAPRALRHRVELLKAKLLSPSLTSVERATLEARLADSQTALESVLRGVHATQQRAAFARFSLDLVTGRGTAIAPAAQPGAFERTADDALGRDLGGRSRRALRRHRRRPVRAARRRCSGGSRGASGAALSGGCSRAS